MRRRAFVALSCLVLSAIAATPAGSDRASSSERTTTTPATRPLVSLLLGTYRGNVVDDDVLVPCVTTFRDRDGRLVGAYVVREGDERYDGTLDRFELLSDDRRECRFHWKDRHGEGVVTMVVSPDGKSFAGSWGLEVVQDRLVWRGTRADASEPQTRTPARSRRAE